MSRVWFHCKYLRGESSLGDWELMTLQYPSEVNSLDQLLPGWGDHSQQFSLLFGPVILFPLVFPPSSSVTSFSLLCSPYFSSPLFFLAIPFSLLTFVSAANPPILMSSWLIFPLLPSPHPCLLLISLSLRTGLGVVWDQWHRAGPG